MKFTSTIFLEALLSKIIRRGPKWYQLFTPVPQASLLDPLWMPEKKTISFFSMAVSAVLGWILPGVYQPDTLVRPSARLKAD
jgi:hypothetical protein